MSEQENKLKALFKGGDYDGKTVLLPKAFPALSLKMEVVGSPDTRVELGRYRLASESPLVYEFEKLD